MKKSCGFYLMSICIVFIKSYSGYEIPLVQLELVSDDGFTLSLKDDPGIRSVFYVIELNEKCQSFMDLVLESLDSKWSTTQNSTALQPRDRLKIYILVNFDGEAYKSQQYLVYGENENIANLLQDQQDTMKCDSKIETHTNECDPSETIVKEIKEKICPNQLIFEENFDGPTLDDNRWDYDVRCLFQGKIGEEFALLDSREENIFLSDGNLNIKPSFMQVDMTKLHFNFGPRCTPVYGVRRECKIIPFPPLIYVPPVNSSQINTRDSFHFKYGKIEIRAKLPKGDWLLPYIVLENYKAFERKQIRIAFARGNEELLTKDDLQDLGGRRLYGGLVKDEDERRRVAILRDTYNFEHYGNEFHVFSLVWTKDAITLAVDGKDYGEIREKLSDFNDYYSLSLGLSFGGHLEFPDNLQNATLKPWQNGSPRAIHYLWRNYEDGKFTWPHNATMQIDYVKIYAV